MVVGEVEKSNGYGTQTLFSGDILRRSGSWKFKKGLLKIASGGRLIMGTILRLTVRGHWTEVRKIYKKFRIQC